MTSARPSVVVILAAGEGKRMKSATPKVLHPVAGRSLHGHVIDFVQVHYAGWYFPSFNVADSAITLGAACLILDELLRVRRAR